jgi:hypothetical protein
MVPLRLEADESVTVPPEIVPVPKLQFKIKPLGSCRDEGEEEEDDVPDEEEPEDGGGVEDAGIWETTLPVPTILAAIAVLPWVRTVARPVDETLATLGAEEVQETLDVRLRLLPSL